MARGTREQTPPSPSAVFPCGVPAGAPDWVTSDLLEQTIIIWQPYYDEALTVDDALEMLVGVGSLLRVFAAPSVDTAI